MIILGIETSCDETAVSIVEDGTKIFSNIVASSAELHVKTGGIIPEFAARQQIKNILPVLEESFRSNKSIKNIKNVDAIAVTIGPGLIGSLLVGVETSKTLSYFWKKPIIPVNHLVAHIYANWLGVKSPQFPLIALVVSGGHTDLVYMKGHGKINLIGTTRDDAAGECFDKCARLLGLPYPGGPAIAAAANKESGIMNQELKLFPRPMINSNDFDFSFSGLKTAVLNETKDSGSKMENVRRYAAEIQEAVVDVLVAKTLKAVEYYKPKSLVFGGGVSANSRLKEKMTMAINQNELSVDLHIPDPKLCTDNAVVIASCAFFNYKPLAWQKIATDPELTIAS